VAFDCHPLESGEYAEREDAPNSFSSLLTFTTE